MDDDEIVAFIVAGLIALWTLWAAVLPLCTVRLMRGSWRRWPVIGALLFALAGLLVVLRYWAAVEVRQGPEYISLFMVCGLAVMGLLLRFSGLLGVDARDDALERGNGAALAALVGAILGVMLVFAGANIGEGPTIWTTLGPAWVGLSAWAILWGILQAATRVAEALAIERDAAAGFRLGGMLVGNGMILGRAAAGNWISPGNMAAQFLQIGWAALVLTMAAGLMQYFLAPVQGVRRDPVLAGLVPGLVLAGMGLLWVLIQGGV